MTKMKVLVCGASGFIGRNIALKLGERTDLEVYGTHFKRDAFEHPNIRMRRVDLTDPAQVDEVARGMDVIIQAAATTSGSADIVDRPYIHTTDNAVMNSLLLRSAYENAVKHFIFFSCTIMYQSSDKPVKESDFDANNEVYHKYFGAAWTKLYIEKMCEFYSSLSRTRHTVLRHSNIYGPFDKFDLERSHVLGATITKVLNNTDGTIRVWGQGREERDLLYVDDLCDVVELALAKQTESFGLYNVGLGSAISVADLVRLVVERSGKTLSIDFDASKPSIKTSLSLDCERVRTDFGWMPKTTLIQGIDRTIAWWRANIPKNI